MKAEMVSEIAKMSEEMHQASYEKLLVGVQEQCKQQLKKVLDDLHTALSRNEQQAAAQVAALQEQLAQSSQVPEHMFAEILQLRDSVEAVRSVQLDSLYGV